MSVIISSDLVVSESLSDAIGGGGTVTENNPIISWESIAAAATLSATSEDADHPVINLLNKSTNNYWLATSTAIQYLTVETLSADDVDHFAVARHNFATAGIAVSVEVDDGSGYEEVVAPAVPGSDGPLIVRWTAGPATNVRLKLAVGSEAARAAVMNVGKLLVLQRRIYVGHSPMSYGRQTDVVNGRSERGEYLGRIVLSEFKTTSVSLQNLTPWWYRNYLDPFVEAATRDLAFFFAWRPGDYPEEVGYGALTNMPIPRNQRSNGMMQIDFQMSGIGADLA